MKYLRVNVFRNASFEAMGCDCTNNGLTHNVTDGLLFWDCTVGEAIKWCNENGYLPQLQFIMYNRILWDNDYSFAEPLIKPTGVQTFGGNFIYTSDSRLYKFGKEVTNRPIPVHDRFEN